MRDLAVQASNDSLSADERGYLESEHTALAGALDDALGQAKFNGQSLIDQDGTSFTIQSGADNTDEVALSLDGLTDSVLRVAPADVTLDAARAERAVFDDFAYGSHGAYTVTLTAASGSDTTITATTVSGDTITDLAGDLTTAATGITFSVSDGQLIATWDATGTQAASYSGYTITSSGLGATNDTGAVVYRGTANAHESAQLAISEIDTALTTVASDRASLGALQSQLESTVRNLANVAENTAAAAGRIMDTDYAAETANLTKAQILQQAATSILAQANAQPQSVLTLLQQ
jgi:flagellin